MASSTSDVTAAVGVTTFLHVEKQTVKIIVPTSELKGVWSQALADCPSVRRLADSRASVRICGPVRAAFVVPSSADIVVAATATVAPARAKPGPKTPADVAQDAYSASFAVSALSPIPVAVLELAPYINAQIKPVPLLGRVPAVYVAWDITTGSDSVAARLELSVPLEFSGADWVNPW